ncbi:S1C family serine protease [Microbacterium neungamense]|uniref:S1C family serine protease n=1 Tax=Microbacterium neungamense TaxID=2810535 RepID=UPI00217E3B0E|nr:trypsin-like peptidase domain-containing protein [Microbacterium neungamense]UWF78160.1 trypsin-like peptidase domain-containing protein [Microbacterium neungamense]
MNDKSTPEPTPGGSDSAPGSRIPEGHRLPDAFASTSPIRTGSPAAGHAAPGAAFGAPAQTGPAAPADGSAAPAARKPGGAAKVAGLLLAAALVGGAAGFGGSAIGQAVFAKPATAPASGPETITVNNPGSVNETTAIATEVLPSVVTIEVAGAQESGSGSGVILDEDGYVLTNTHVVTLGGAASDPAIRVTTSDGRIYTAEIVGTDPVYDLAVIRLQDAEDLTPIEFADSSELNVGDTAVAVGAPLGLSNSVTTGIVSALNRSIQIASAAAPDTGQDQQQPEEEQPGEGGPFQFDIPGLGAQQATQSISIAVIQTDAAINPGNSGGALVDSQGRLIGINVAIATAGGTSSGEAGSIGLGFAIPSDIAERIANELMENGEATHGLLGATVRDAAAVEDATVAGAYIEELTPRGAASEAGLQQGDIVTGLDGVPITGASDLTAQVRAAAAGSTVTLTIVREGQSQEIEVTLGELEL